MSSSQPSLKTILLLLASPPVLTQELVVDRIEGNRFFVLSPELPEFPPWQYHDLTPWLYPPPWLAQHDSRWGPLPPKEHTRQDEVAFATVQKLIQRLRQHPEVYAPVRKEFRDLWTDIVIGFSADAPRSGLPLTDVDRVLYTMLVVFDLAMLISLPGSAPDSQPIPVSITRESDISRSLTEKSGDIRRSLRTCLQEVEVQPDDWHEQALFGLLLHPQGMVWVEHLFSLAPSNGRTELERGMNLAIDAPETSYRSSNKVQRAYRRAWGAQREPERPGPKPGQPRQLSDDWQEFEHYVVQSRLLGLSPQLICQDAEAQRLYSIARLDHSAELNEQTVRRVLRKHT